MGSSMNKVIVKLLFKKKSGLFQLLETKLEHIRENAPKCSHQRPLLYGKQTARAAVLKELYFLWL